MKIFKCLLIFLFCQKVEASLAQSNLDMDNVVVKDIFNPDSLATKFQIKSLIISKKYGKMGDITIKKYDPNGYLIFQKDKIVDTTKNDSTEISIYRNSGITSVVYKFNPKGKIFFNEGFTEFNSIKNIDWVNSSFRKEYSLFSDTMVLTKTFVNGIETKRDSFLNYSQGLHAILINVKPDKDERYVKPNSKKIVQGDSIIYSSTFNQSIDSIWVIESYFIDNGNKLVRSVNKCFNADKSKIFEYSEVEYKYNKKLQIISYREYVGINRECLVLKSFSYNNQFGGITEIDGLGTKTSWEYDKNKKLVRYIKYTFDNSSKKDKIHKSVILNTFNKNGLLLKESYSLDSKRTGIGVYKYTFY